MPNMARPRPDTAEIIAALRTAEDLDTHALGVNDAIRVLRRTFRTTNVAALRWLGELSASDTPPLHMIHTSRGGVIASVWRTPGWLSISLLNLPDGSRGADDWITLRHDGGQTLDPFSGADDRQWVILPGTATRMGERVRELVRKREQAERERLVADEAAFENAHPHAVGTVHELLRRAGVGNGMTTVQTSVRGRTGSRTGGIMIGGSTMMTITLCHEDISAVVAELVRLGVTSQTGDAR